MHRCFHSLFFHTWPVRHRILWAYTLHMQARLFCLLEARSQTFAWWTLMSVILSAAVLYRSCPTYQGHWPQLVCCTSCIHERSRQSEGAAHFPCNIVGADQAEISGHFLCNFLGCFCTSCNHKIDLKRPLPCPDCGNKMQCEVRSFPPTGNASCLRWDAGCGDTRWR